MLRAAAQSAQQQQQQVEEQAADEERRRSGSAASTSSSSSGSSGVAAATSLLDGLLHRSGSSAAETGLAASAQHKAAAEGQARNTAVDVKYKPFLDAWDRGFIEAEEEPEGYFMEVVQGQVPPELTGTLFRNGPGRFSVGGQPFQHPYDGDGFILSIAFKDGRAFFRSRFVRTAEYEAESAKQRVLFRGTFATQRPGGAASNAMDVYVKNTANTNVVHWGGRLWALFEAGQPYRLDPATLETQGLETLGGQVQPGLPFDLGAQAANEGFSSMVRGIHQRLGSAQHMPPELFNAGGDAVTAHPHVDSSTGRLVTFSYKVGPSIRQPPLPPWLGTELNFLELEADFSVAAQRTFHLAGFAFLHDMAVTPNYYVVFQNPVTVDNLPYILGRAPAAACVRWVEGKPTLLHLIPRPGRTDAEGRPLEARTFTLPPLFIFHHANAYEADDGQRIVVDSIHYDSLPAVGREALAEQQIDPDVAFRSRLRRVEVDLRTVVQRITGSFDEYLEMVAINETRFGRPHRYVYGYNSVFDVPQIGIAKIDMEGRQVSLYRPGHQHFLLEPKFVPRPGGTREDDGWLLSVGFHSGTQESFLVILDAQQLEAGPVATLRFRRPVPSGLHGCWTSEYYGPHGMQPN
ncbi:Apocarotenoid-15,15 -oxygenase [Chlorella sorokiniana]|uniref:Apocarotenoid-15,15-oxygenase n=1 Tax=Chlorella sorokiniana TaxID=3076 RepID=A0A2P6TZG3_CHLSO|nr:Apocarotenoid-15,15 -oxygenase [Chlorella sorokiniana]|eukprot:PRW59430.1 Apocarotenoid-15,15 -oxygenase [Chlorella sorokiniana]